MLNQWQFSNIIAGAASVRFFGPRPDYSTLMAEILARAAAEQSTVEVTLKRHMRERMAGQLLVAVTSLAAVAGAGFGTIAGWSDLIVIPLAITPSALMIAASATHRRSPPNA